LGAFAKNQGNKTMNENLIELIREAAGTLLILCHKADQPQPYAEALARELNNEADRMRLEATQ
jgi:hypothetical protein